MIRPYPKFRSTLSAALCALALPAFGAAFDSGSTGANGAFAPTADTTVQLPASGILHYTTVNIPAGVTVKFARNAANTPVVMLASGDVSIAGTIDISGGASQHILVGPVGDANFGGVGGPGGFNGGRGGLPETNRNGGTGLGFGGGLGGTLVTGCGGHPVGGGGGGFIGTGANSHCGAISGGAAYGSNNMLPVVGGSGGGGGAGGFNATSLAGSGGGGGGGALMIVASGTVQLTGSVLARGGNAGNIRTTAADCTGVSSSDAGGAGGGGSGGAVRIIASAYSGTGTINVAGGIRGCNLSSSGIAGGNGAAGRTSVEVVSGGTFNVAVLPSLAITSIGGVAVPANATGAGDVTLPAEMANPIPVEVAASGIPVGTVVKLTLSRPYNTNVVANASALAGTLQASTSSGLIDIPQGPSTLIASTSYTLTLAQGEALSVYAQGERVDRVELAASLGGAQTVTLITASGKTFDVPAAVLATIPG